MNWSEAVAEVRGAVLGKERGTAAWSPPSEENRASRIENDVHLVIRSSR